MNYDELTDEEFDEQVCQKCGAVLGEVSEDEPTCVWGCIYCS